MKGTHRALPNTIGGRIQALRMEKGLTQAELAKELAKLIGREVKRETVNQWESETRDLKTAYTIALANYFGRTCDYILRGVEAENVAVHEKTGLSNAAIEELAFTNGIGGSTTIYILSKLLESYGLIAILSNVSILNNRYMQKLVYEYEDNKDNSYSPMVGGRPLHDLLRQEPNYIALEDFFYGPVELNPSQAYSYFLSDLEKEFGRMINELNENIHQGKSASELKNEIREAKEGMAKGLQAFQKEQEELHNGND